MGGQGQQQDMLSGIISALVGPRPPMSPRMDTQSQTGENPWGQQYPVEDWMTRSGSGVAQTPMFDPAVDFASMLAPAMLSRKAFTRIATETGALGRALLVPEGFAEESVVRRQFTGKPIRVYHGTTNEFDNFDMMKAKDGLYGRGLYFTEDPSIAGGRVSKIKDEYSNLGYAHGMRPSSWEHAVEQQQAHARWLRQNPDAPPQAPIIERPNVRPAFLNISRPLRMDAKKVDNYFRQVVYETYERRMHAIGENVDPNRVAMIRRSESNEHLYDILTSMYGYNKNSTNAALQKEGYDGITHIGGLGSPDARTHRVWIAFDPKQVVSAFESSK